MKSQFGSAMALYGFLVLGVFLVFAPWTSIWERAILGWLPESSGPLLLSGWVRGIISSLGALDLLVAGQIAIEIWNDAHGES